jgi:hypothetical protein
MNEIKKKKKWYDTWWGLLWTLAIIDANPGQGMQVFMEVDKDMRDLKIEDDKPSMRPLRSKEKRATNISPAMVPADCKI